MTASGITAGDPALVVFSGMTEISWLRLLRPGFRHCFVAVSPQGGDGGSWIVCNPLFHHTEIGLCSDVSQADLAKWFRESGMTVVGTRITPPPMVMAPWRPYTCVEAVKRILGIHAPGILTPWQLYRHLTSGQ